MLLGFPSEFWDQQSIENSICSFGRLLSWENDPSNLARLIIRARVVDLEKVPEFIVITEGEGFKENPRQCNVRSHSIIYSMVYLLMKHHSLSKEGGH